MTQKFYTQEGKPYILRRETKITSFVLLAPEDHRLLVFINNPTITNVTLIPNVLVVATEKKLIPVECTYSVVDANSGNVLVDVTSPYYWLRRGTTNYTLSYENIASMTKGVPLIERVYYNDVNHFAYSFRYGQAVYTENDFIAPTSGLLFNFENNLANGMTVSQGDPHTLPAGEYIATMTFTYFELE